jgi:hypothetical protein
MHPPKNPHESYNPFHPERYQEQIQKASADNYPDMATNSPLPSLSRPGIERFMESSGAPRPGTCWGPQISANYGSDEVDDEDDDEGDWSPAHKNHFQKVPNTQHYMACAPPKPVAGPDGIHDILAKFHHSEHASKESYQKLVGSDPGAFRKVQPAYLADQNYHGQLQSSSRNGADDQDTLSNPFDDGHQLTESMRGTYKRGPRSKSSQASSATAHKSIRSNFSASTQGAGYHFAVMPSGTSLVTDEELSAAIAKPWERASKQHDMVHKFQTNNPRHHSDGNGEDRLMDLPSRPSSLEQHKAKSGDRRVDRWSPVHRQSNGSDDRESGRRPGLYPHDSGYGSPGFEQVAGFPHNTQSDIRDFGKPNTWSKHSSGTGGNNVMQAGFRPGSGSDSNAVRGPNMLYQCPSLADIKRSRNGSASTQGNFAPGGAWDPAAYSHNSKRGSNNTTDGKQQALRQWVEEDYPPPEFPSHSSSKSESSDADSECTKATFSYDPRSGQKLIPKQHESTILSDLNGMVDQCEIIYQLICKLRILQPGDRMMEVLKRKQIDTGLPAALAVLHKKILVTIDVLNHIERPFEGLQAKRVKAAFEMVSYRTEHVASSY